MNVEVLNEKVVHADMLRRGQMLEYFTIGWNSLEAVVAISFGIVAGSVALVGFGVDSVIESSSGAILLWRLFAGEERERIALRLVGVSLLLLAAYVAFDAVKSLLFQEKPDESYIGIALAVASLIVMPILAREKERLRRD